MLLLFLSFVVLSALCFRATQEEKPEVAIGVASAQPPLQLPPCLQRSRSPAASVLCQDQKGTLKTRRRRGNREAGPNRAVLYLSRLGGFLLRYFISVVSFLFLRAISARLRATEALNKADDNADDTHFRVVADDGVPIRHRPGVLGCVRMRRDICITTARNTTHYRCLLRRRQHHMKGFTERVVAEMASSENRLGGKILEYRRRRKPRLLAERWYANTRTPLFAHGI